MHPTRTSTKLLLGAACAVSAVSGCVNVAPGPGRPATAPSAGLPPQYAPRGGPGALPVVVQAPALEALGAVPGEAARPSAPTAAARGTARTTPGTPSQALEAVPPVPDIPEPQEPARQPHGHRHDREDAVRKDVRVPRELMRELPVRPADVCALGRRHGRWHPDSPEARICAGVHDG
ncbi:hypothetical protein [Streptomyces sp. NPDC059564]|uniref:hypothetical protein n=1 Tax=Streptomyces sp. NPDC059564 TaxID=3346865 RepID=UPI0036BECF51